MTPDGEAPLIREATAADRPAMLDLWVEAWTAAYPVIDFEGRRHWFDAHLDALSTRGSRLVVCSLECGRVAGFVTIDPRSGELDQLVTAIWAQRRGIGRVLLRHAKRMSPGGVTISVNAFNALAIRLYETEGFQKFGEGIGALAGLPIWHMRWAEAAPAGMT